MEIEGRVLYNLLRMNWLQDPTIPAEPWQVENYRTLAPEQLFSRLQKENILLDRISFTTLAQDFASPEEMAESLVQEIEDLKQCERIFLLIFELWRRFVPEKLCLSIFCDELDYQINLYDCEELQDTEALQDAIANLAVILDDNTDAGMDPKQVFITINERCACDLESFFYDFISEQIDSRNLSYASELIDDFEEFLEESLWFDLLKAKLLIQTDSYRGNMAMRKIAFKAASEQDLEFNLEMLASLIQGGDRDIFADLVEQSLPLLKTEEDFQDLLTLSVDYLQFADDEKEACIKQMLDTREASLSAPFNPSDSNAKTLLGVLNYQKKKSEVRSQKSE